jgi:hypothetical protein
MKRRSLGERRGGIESEDRPEGLYRFKINPSTNSVKKTF